MMYDVAVIGAGVEGSSTAYHLARSGARVLLLEQFGRLHTRGSSHGQSRITRRAYVQPYYVAMMHEAFQLWEQIEKEGGTKLYTCTGILVFGPAENESVASVITSLSTHKVPHKVFSGKEAKQRYPGLLRIPDDFVCVFEEDGGILLASQALATLQRLFVAAGGEFLDNHQVTAITPGPEVTIATNHGNFQARRLVITAGAWAPRIARQLGVELPFTVIRAEVHYWKTDRPDEFSSQNFPTFIICGSSTDDEGNFYGLPVHEYPGLIKICQHTGPVIDPDHRDAEPAPASTAAVAKLIKTTFNFVSTTPSIYESCMYTVSPDENPVLDRHPQFSNIIIGAGFSGHGFKLSPVVGKLLCELALDLPPSHDLTPFRLDRFNKEQQP